MSHLPPKRESEVHEKNIAALASCIRRGDVFTIINGRIYRYDETKKDDKGRVHVFPKKRDAPPSDADV